MFARLVVRPPPTLASPVGLQSYLLRRYGWTLLARTPVPPKRVPSPVQLDLQGGPMVACLDLPSELDFLGSVTYIA